MSPLAELPPHLEERTRWIGQHVLREAGRFILYWMRTAVRGHENPALDVALCLANRRRVPVLVYHAVSERYPYASDRHHTFILEGTRDVSRELGARGIPYALHVERPNHRGPHLRTLAERALAVVTEDFPIEPLQGWTLALAARAPLAVVDTACVVPMKQVGQAYERAFAFAEATRPLRAARLSAPWVDVEPSFPMALPDLPFTPVEPEGMDLSSLVARAEIDHSVGPVPDTRGGSEAGYARFAAFVESSLDSYNRTRNDPLAASVSRMSAYLHYGHVSPLRLARCAALRQSPGADKYLDELLTWRELAYNFAAYTPELSSLAALPAWARASLEAHRRDPRPSIFSWETLARSRTGDALWDAAQCSLRVHGELHNNVRMTWGKALVEWSPDASAALELLIDLNHRYALDGRDPASFGGILWCLGQFDRPFEPERAVLGTVRPRPTSEHARRLNVAAYAARCSVPPRALRVAVIGAGLSGLACARTLHDHGWPVTLVDKGRRPGGRASSRRDGDAAFDHGAQFFTARSEWLTRHVTSWEADGVVARWAPRIVQTGGARARRAATWWVGTPTMGAVAAHLARDLDVRVGATVTSLARAPDGTWSIAWSDENGALGTPLEAEAVVVSLPAAQCAALLAVPHPQLAQVALSARQTPCWAVMATLRDAFELGADVFEDGQGPVAWATREASKPGRSGALLPGANTTGPVHAGEARWLLHASPAWSEAHLGETPEAVGRALTEAFFEARGVRLTNPPRVVAHLWRYAQGHLPEPQGALFDRDTRLVVCGDWVNGSRIEGALTSGVAAAGLVLSLAAGAHRQSG